MRMNKKDKNCVVVSFSHTFKAKNTQLTEKVSRQSKERENVYQLKIKKKERKEGWKDRREEERKEKMKK